jgi:hypothetical protein
MTSKLTIIKHESNPAKVGYSAVRLNWLFDTQPMT